MDWFQSKTTQLIALAGIVSTLAGFGYTGATYVNRIENLESKMTRYINEIDTLADEVADMDKQVVSLAEQIKSLNIETEDLTPIKDDIVLLQTSVAGINASVDSMYDDIKALENKNDNPLAQ